jgi:hypothetical protein
VSKEELLTDVKNLLYRRTDDVERLQKVIGDGHGHRRESRRHASFFFFSPFSFLFLSSFPFFFSHFFLPFSFSISPTLLFSLLPSPPFSSPLPLLPSAARPPAFGPRRPFPPPSLTHARACSRPTTPTPRTHARPSALAPSPLAAHRPCPRRARACPGRAATHAHAQRVAVRRAVPSVARTPPPARTSPRRTRTRTPLAPSPCARTAPSHVPDDASTPTRRRTPRRDANKRPKRH